LTTFERLGAGPWVARAKATLRATGQAVPVYVGPRLSSLPPRDLDIAQLAASGMTNRQIGDQLHLSHRTVGAALGRLFPLLGITSRAALRDALAGLEEAGPSP
jgi:DNA-binding NarL/FixJ family response regulator